MTTPEWPSHGGQAEALLERFGLPGDHVVDDVSANLNPLGPSEWVSGWLADSLGGLGCYPEPSYATARHAIAAHHQLHPDQVLLTNGGAEAIFLAAALHAGKRAAVLAPSFGEYARACAAHRLQVTKIPLSAPSFALDQATLLEHAAEAEVVFLCRPNNPTGTLIECRVIDALLAATLARGTQVVVDEAFIDMALGAEALTPLLARYPNLILLRSMTKFYTLPGLRLGYVLASSAVIEALSAHQPPWSVNHLAAELVKPLLEDHAFAERTHAWLASQQPSMFQALAVLGLDVVPSTTCFFLVRPGEAQRRRGMDAAWLFERLLRGGILARHTHGFAGLEGEWLRLAVRDEAGNTRLLEGLHDCLR
ncbi:MAG: threonine-phosphate decarboxylase CobD [Pseudomonadota bacterium]